MQLCTIVNEISFYYNKDIVDPNYSWYNYKLYSVMKCYQNSNTVLIGKMILLAKISKHIQNVGYNGIDRVRISCHKVTNV